MKGLFGKLVGGFDVKDLISDFITGMTADLVRPVFLSFFLTRMNADSRVALGKRLVECGTELQAGECAAAAEKLAEVVEEIQL